LALQALRFAFNQASREATDAAKTKPKRETLGPDLQKERRYMVHLQVFTGAVDQMEARQADLAAAAKEQAIAYEAQT
jgi:hypothetical protein